MTLPGKKMRFLLLLGLMISAVAASYFSQDRSLSQLRKAGVIRIGYALEPPYAFLTPGGEVSGESPEIAKVITRRLGIPRIEWRVVEFSELIDDLNAGYIDVIAAGMFITQQRQERIRFSEPTFHVKQGLLVAMNNPHDLHSYAAALQTSGIRLAVLSGSIEENLLQQLGAQDHQLMRVPDAQTGKIAVATGQAAGLALSQPTLRWMKMQSSTQKTMLANPFQQPSMGVLGKTGYGAFAFRIKDKELLTAWNAAMKDFINSHEHAALVFRFGFSRDELPGEITTQEVLSR